MVGAAVAAAQAPPSAPAPVLVKELVVEGTRRVQEAVVLGAVQTKIGAPFNPTFLTQDVRAIFALGFFDDVQMRVDDFEGGVKVTFVVTERPFIRDIDFVGNKRVATSALQEKIDLRLGAVYNPVDVQTGREKLMEQYEEEGYFEAQITPSVEKFADGDVRITFTIDEGRRMTIDRVVFLGNKGLTDKQLKAPLATQERQFYILRGTVQRQKLEEDVERILQTYSDHGYTQARVESHDVKVDRERARVTIEFVVTEGPQYRVGEVKVSGVTLLPESEVRRLIKLKTGDVFARTKIRESMQGITALYSTIGRASADVVPKTDQSPGTQTMDVVFEITEGPE
ncbi:MAG: hypothetical protein DMD81_25770, partial [Candidatus Rokuibacteriota bacterium]